MAECNIPKVLKVGVSKVDITPWADVQVSGSVGVRRKAQAVLDPLFARAIVFDNGKKKMCLIAADLTLISRQAGDYIRNTAANRFGFDREAVIIHLTQTHTSPSLGHCMFDPDFKLIPDEYDWIRGGDRKYTEFAQDKILDAIDSALKKLQQVEIGVQDASEGRLTFNRRGIRCDRVRSVDDPTREGILNKLVGIGMPGRRWSKNVGQTWIRYLEGPIDPQVLMMCFRTENLKIVSALLNYASHPVHVFDKQLISADWPGAWCEGVGQLMGRECIPLTLNGCCGNLNPWDPWDPNYPNDHIRMGKMLTKHSENMLGGMDFFSDTVLDYESIHLKIPYRKVPNDVLAEAKTYLGLHPEIIWTDETRRQVNAEWYRHAMILSIDREQKREGGMMDYEIQVFRIGPVALVSLPGEPFVEGQLQIKIQSPVYFTFVMHMTNQYVGYVPTRNAFALSGGHETDLSTWSKLAPEALDMIVDEATKVLHRMFSDLNPAEDQENSKG
jgi:neutral ceramidase